MPHQVDVGIQHPSTPESQWVQRLGLCDENIDEFLDNPARFAESHGIAVDPSTLEAISKQFEALPAEIVSLCEANPYLTEDDRKQFRESRSRMPDLKAMATLVETIAIGLALIVMAKKIVTLKKA